jgi:hypothetical protein
VNCAIELADGIRSQLPRLERHGDLALAFAEAQGAFFYSMGMTINGGKVIHKYV